MKKNSLYREMLRTVAAYQMLEGQRGVLVGYSGGADSSALLYIMKQLCDERGLYIHALHVNHGIRGDEADRDADFCKHECERMGVDFTMVSGDIPTFAEEIGCGIEEAARRFRYDAFFGKLKSDERLTCVATAHNADDNAETVIFNMVRGSGIAGMCGIPPVRVTDGTKVIRPLIACTKDDITEYCTQNGIKYIFDSTNADTAYTRNYIRHEVIPGLRNLNPSLSTAIFRMTETLRSDRKYLDSAADDFVRANVRDGKIAVSVLSAEDYPIASRAVAGMISRLNFCVPEKVHIDAVLDLVRYYSEGSEVTLSGGIRAVTQDGRLYFTAESEYVPTEFLHELDFGVNRFNTPDFAVFAAKNGKTPADLQKDNETLQNIYKLSILTQVNSDKIKNRLFVRSRQNGDSYVFGGMTRKLKKLYNDRGFSSKKRAELPVFCDGDGIVWVPGFPPADRVKPYDGEECLTLVYYFNGEEK